MALNNAAMVIAANALRGALLYAQLHSAAAGGSGTSNLCSSARLPITWAAASGNGDFDLAAALAFTGIASSGAVYSVTFWSASSSGTWYGEQVLTGDAAANVAGQYTVNSLAQDGNAT